jgi:hypothetical protein
MASAVAAADADAVLAATRQGVVDGLNLVFLVAAVIAFVGALAAWPLLGDLRSGTLPSGGE